MAYSAGKKIRFLASAFALALASAGAAFAADTLALSGAHEVPANTSAATGTGSITVAADKSVSGSVTVTGMTPTAAHIHEAAPGKNGGVIVPLAKEGENTFKVPAGTKLSDAQYAAYQAGNLYVNVHSKANPGGEVRAQLTPAK
jgi:hypothetical protein